MGGYTATTSIDAPIDTVWALVVDLGTHPDWAADELAVEQVDERTWQTTAHAKGTTFTADVTVVEATRPERFVFEVVDQTGRWRHRFDLEATGSGCVVTRHVEPLALTPGQRLLYWIVRIPVKQPALRTSLDRLATVAQG